MLTVRLFCRRPLPQVRAHSLGTPVLAPSVALLSILLREKFALTPQLIEAPPDLAAMLDVADAALLIGDEVFPHLDADLESLDLGREWTAMTDLPFVFAFWAGREQALTPAQVQQLQRAKDGGIVPSAVYRRSVQPRMRRLARVLRALPDSPHPL